MEVNFILSVYSDCKAGYVRSGLAEVALANIAVANDFLHMNRVKITLNAANVDSNMASPVINCTNTFTNFSRIANTTHER